ncbi:MAG: terminase small subunit [Parvibaculales bacterium]
MSKNKLYETPVYTSDEEEGKKSKISARQKEFAKLIVEGVYSNTECARRAGYSEDSANTYASKLLNGRDFPLVPKLISDLRQEKERKYGVTLIGQLKRLTELSRAAEDGGQFSAAINAEKIRASLGGLTVDRRENQHVHKYDAMSREEIVAQLENLRQEHPAAFIEADYEVIPDGDTGTKSMDAVEESTAAEDTHDKD